MEGGSGTVLGIAALIPCAILTLAAVCWAAGYCGQHLLSGALVFLPAKARYHTLIFSFGRWFGRYRRLWMPRSNELQLCFPCSSSVCKNNNK